MSPRASFGLYRKTHADAALSLYRFYGYRMRTVFHTIPRVSLDVHIRVFDPKRDMERFVALNFQTFWDSIPEGEKIPQDRFGRIHAEMMKRYAPEDPDRSRITIASLTADEYIGHLWLGLQTDFFTQELTPWVLDLTVRPEYRRQGVGKLLLDDCLKRSREMGFARLGLQVLNHNPAAVRFYEREGFRVKSRTMLRDM